MPNPIIDCHENTICNVCGAKRGKHKNSEASERPDACPPVDFFGNARPFPKFPEAETEEIASEIWDGQITKYWADSPGDFSPRV